MPDHLHEDHNYIPHVSTGTAPPTAAPVKIGDFFIDLTNKIAYVAVGTTDSGDWEALNQA